MGSFFVYNTDFILFKNYIFMVLVAHLEVVNY